MTVPKITCSSCHEHAERAIAEVHHILAHHPGLRVDIRLLSDETLADGCIHRLDRAAQEAS